MSEEKNNLELWNKVKTPDPKYTKTFKRAGGFSGTATNTQYIIQLATEVWGKNGSGWGVSIDNEDYVTGAPIIIDGNIVGNEIVHVVRGCVWYIEDGTKQETSQQFGQTTFVGKNKYGAFTDEEAPKKSVTDMMLKCLSLLGFSADIFLGLYDDNKYVNDANKKYRQKEYDGSKYEAINAFTANADKAATSQDALAKWFVAAKKSDKFKNMTDADKKTAESYVTQLSEAMAKNG